MSEGVQSETPMLRFPILTRDDEQVGYVRESLVRNPAVAIIATDARCKAVMTLNKKIQHHERIAGTTGHTHVITTVRNSRSRFALFPRIQSLSGAELHVGDTETNDVE